MTKQTISIAIEFDSKRCRCCYLNRTTNEYELLKFNEDQTYLPISIDFNVSPPSIGTNQDLLFPDIQKLIGIKYNDPIIQQMIQNKSYPFEIKPDDQGYCKIDVPNSLRKIRLPIVEIFVLILYKIKI